MMNRFRLLLSRGLCAVALILALPGCQGGLLSMGGRAVSGKVLDASGSGVPGVTISAEGTERSTVTDRSGAFTLDGLPGLSVTLHGQKTGFVVIPRFGPPANGGASLLFDSSAMVVADFVAVAPDALTIPLVQGPGARSPLEGQRVDGVRGVVTMVTRKVAHALYETLQYDGTSTPQWISEDGFFMEAVVSDKDGDPSTSDGIFVSTHNAAYTESKWLEGIPTDLKEGDLVLVSGLVVEDRPQDRFNNSASYLTRTSIHAASVVPVTEAGVRKTAAFPDGVVLTFDPSTAGALESLTLPWQDGGLFALGRAIALLESVEGMVVRVNDPLVTSSTYYNLTGILADGGKKGGVFNTDHSGTWRSIVLKEGDFNTELLYADYQKPDWKTFQPLPQVGDVLIDAAGSPALRGLMDYTADAVYMIRPLQLAASLTGRSGSAVPSQGWNFDNSKTWYPGTIQGAMKSLASADRTTIASWRMGSTADPKFIAPWNAGEADHLTVAAFNLENYVNQGKPYAKNVDLAKIFVFNLKSPDVIAVMELGDDNATVPFYVNQADSYSLPDAVVTAVQNCRDLVDQIKLLGGPTYDFREIDPQEGQEGGAPGNNIRVGFLFRTDRVAFADRGIPENTYATTAGSAKTWPVPAPSLLADQLATAATGVATDPAGKPFLTQSPGRLQDPSFRSSRKPLVGEFTFLPSGKTFFVISAHLNSKGGDKPLYGEQQPPALTSETNRIRQATVVNAFVRRLLAVDAQAKVVVAGDMNDFPFSLPLKILKGDLGGAPVLYSPTERFLPANEQFSYAYRGNLQQIDHVLVSPALYDWAKTEAASDPAKVVFIAHIDSLFSKNNHIQTSDHDPLAVRLGGF